MDLHPLQPHTITGVFVCSYSLSSSLCACLPPCTTLVLFCFLAFCAGFKALVDAFTEVVGDCKPYSITGSLPCIRDLQDAGFDVQTLGFGKLAAYHANNEYGFLSDFAKGMRVLAVLMQKYNDAVSA